MTGYSQAICAPAYVRSNGARERTVARSASFLLPSFGTVVFAVALLQVLFLSQGGRTLFRDSDTGWHIRNGEGLLATASAPRLDTFSYTRNGAPWFAWEWLSDALFGTAHGIGGLTAVALLSGIVIALTAWGVARLSLSLGGNLFITAGGIVVLFGTTTIHWLARPHVFSWLLSLIVVAIAEQERCSKSRFLYVLPVIACLWANVHGSFLLAPALLFIYAIGNWLIAQPAVRFAGAASASLAATFINPYGWHLHVHVFSYLSNNYLMDHISEFRSFSFHAPGAMYVELFLVIAVLGTMALLKQKAYGPALLALGMLHLSLYSARHLPTAAVLLLPLFVAALTREAKNRPALRAFFGYSERLQSIDAQILGIVPLAIVLVLTVFGASALARSGNVGFDPSVFPVRAADYLEQHDSGGRVFSKDQWGGYLIYRFKGETKVFLDGRSDFYGQDLLETYAKVIEVKPGWDGVLKQYDVQRVLIPPDHPLAAVLRLSAGWKLTYGDSVAAVFQRVAP